MEYYLQESQPLKPPYFYINKTAVLEKTNYITANHNTKNFLISGDAMNNFMSTNWEVVYKEMKPVVDEAIAAILTNVGKKVFERFTYDELFPL